MATTTTITPGPFGTIPAGDPRCGEHGTNRTSTLICSRCAQQNAADDKWDRHA